MDFPSSSESDKRVSIYSSFQPDSVWMYVGVLGRQSIAVDKPKNTPPITKFSHPSAMYPGEALNHAHVNDGSIPVARHITTSCFRILVASPAPGSRIGVSEYFDSLRTRRRGWESAISIGLVDSEIPLADQTLTRRVLTSPSPVHALPSHGFPQ